MIKMTHTEEKILKVAIGPVFDEFGGVSQHIFGIKKYSSHKVVEIPPKFVRTVLSKSGRITWLYRKIMNKLTLTGYDVLHSHVDPWFTNLCLSSRTNACKWVHTYHTLYFEEDYQNGLATWQKVINRSLIEVASKADFLISVSQWLHDYLSDRYSIETEVIPNGVDLKECDNASPSRFIKKYSLSNFVLFVGNIKPIKNPQLFVKLAIRMPEVKFVMIGRNLDEINLTKEYGVSIPRNLIAMGEMKHRDVLDAISACTAFVMTSKREGIPTALLEAMGLGKPVIVPDHSGCKEVVHSDDYGFLYEPDSLDHLVEQTKQALTSEHIGENAKERISKIYDWKILAKKIDLIYET